MKYKLIKDLEEEKFRRLTGIKEKIFMKMIEILEKAHAFKKVPGGCPNKLRD